MVDINCQTYESIQDFYKHIYLGLPPVWKSKLRLTLQNAKRFPTRIIDFITDHVETLNMKDLGSVTFRNEVINYSNPLKEELANFFLDQNAQIVLLIDELPFLFENIELRQTETTKLEIEAILTTLRSWREIGVAQGFCGSLNLHIQLEQLGISRKLLGGLTTQNLPKNTNEEAKGLMKKLAVTDGINLTEEDLQLIVDLLPDKIPQFLQHFYFCLKTHWTGEHEEIATIHKKQLYPVIVKDFEYQFNERLAKFPDDQIDLVELILNTLVRKPEISETELLKRTKSKSAYQVLLFLYNQEFIVIDEEQRVDFSFELVRNWWIKKNR